MAFTVNTLIGNNVEVYKDATIRVLFTGSVGETDPALENPYVQIDTLNLINIDSKDPAQFENVQVPLSPDPDNEGQWIGYVYGLAPEDAKTISLTGSANSDTGSGNLITSDVPVTASKGIQDVPIPPLTPTMETAPTEHMKPSEDLQGKYTKILQILINYTAADGSVQPYENYVVEWRTTIHSDFNDRFNVYGSATATEPLEPKHLNKIIYYRTATNEKGIAELCLVSSTQMASDTIACYTTRTHNRKFGSIASISLDENKASYELSAPDLRWPFGVIDLDATKTKNFPVLVEYGSTTGDTVYVYLNGFLNSATQVNSSDQIIADSISRYNLKSTTDPKRDDTVENKLLYAVAQQGLVRTSVQNWFKATGHPGPVEPEDVPRTLPAPFLINHSKTINEDLIKGGLLIFAKKLDENGKLIAEVGDVIIVRIYVDAYEDGTNTPRNGVFPSSDYIVTPDMLEDTTKDFSISISEGYLKGFDSDRNGNSGLARIEYFVSKPDGRKEYSRLDSCRIDTVPPHAKTLLK